MIDWKFIDRHAPGASSAWHQVVDTDQWVVGITGSRSQAVAWRSREGRYDYLVFIDGNWVPRYQCDLIMDERGGRYYVLVSQ